MRSKLTIYACIWLVFEASPLTKAAGVPETPPPSAVTVEGAYTAEFFSVVTGGLKCGSVYRGLAEAAVRADLAMAVGAPADTLLYLSALYPHGGDLSGKLLGDLQGASNIAAYNHPLLYELWVAGKLADDRLVLRVGRLLADSDFATTASGGVFLNSSFGWPAFISANTRNTGPAFDRSALGAFACLEPAERIRLQAGLYDGDSFDDASGDPSCHANGLNFELGRGQGVFAIGEIIVETISGPTTASLPGAVKVGVWEHTADFADQFDPTRNHSGNHGAYAVIERMLWRKSDREPGVPRGVTAFARTGFSPGDRSRFIQTFDGGLSFTGLLPSRDADTFGLGLAWARISNEVRRAERAAGAAVISDYELVVEATYEIAGGGRWCLVPDVQWVRHPGGSRALSDAPVLGLRTRLTF